MSMFNSRRVGAALCLDPLTLIMLVVLALFGQAIAPVAQAQLRISEAMSDASEDYNHDGEVEARGDEFVELVNLGSEDASLDNVFIRDAFGDTYHYGFSGTLAAGEAILVTGSMSMVWQIANDAGSSGLSLNNGGDRLELWLDDPSASPIMLDQLVIPPHAAAKGRSIVLDVVSVEYVLHDGLSPYAGDLVPVGTGCAPSPGIAGTCDGVVPIEAAAWGALKAQFTH